MSEGPAFDLVKKLLVLVVLVFVAMLLAGLYGVVHDQITYTVSPEAFVIVVAFTLAFGLGGLVYGFFRTATIDRAAYQGWFVPANVIELRRYLCVGYMHNASYLRGTLSIVAGWIYQVVLRLRQH